MTHIAIPSPGASRRGLRRLPRSLVCTFAFLAVVTLMALSFAVGTATMSGHATPKPRTPRVTVPSITTAHPITRGGLDCREHRQC